MMQWARNFVDETCHLRRNNQKLLVILDGYGGHIQYYTLKLLRDNNIFVIALPAHSSHRLQPLEVTVFGLYKSFLQAEIHRAARIKSLLNAFDIVGQ